ncbi:hypothetical protein [Peptoniphilus sp.]|jgi:hypothetical protein|uniref:hypothetical protein n=1 Tax=Peptoniphilus sp. TaxID=1971214 RepID=UPI003D93A9AF
MGLEEKRKIFKILNLVLVVVINFKQGVEFLRIRVMTATQFFFVVIIILCKVVLISAGNLKKALKNHFFQRHPEQGKFIFCVEGSVG